MNHILYYILKLYDYEISENFKIEPQVVSYELTGNNEYCLDDGFLNLKNEKDCLGAIEYVQTLFPGETVFWQGTEERHDKPKGCNLVNGYELKWNYHKTGGRRYPNRRGVCTVGRY